MIDMKLYRRAMKAAAKQGFDPYNSHDVQDCKWQRLFALDASRKADEEAKARELWEERRRQRAERVYGWVKISADEPNDGFDSWDWAK